MVLIAQRIVITICYVDRQTCRIKWSVYENCRRFFYRSNINSDHCTYCNPKYEQHWQNIDIETYKGHLGHESVLEPAIISWKKIWGAGKEWYTVSFSSKEGEDSHAEYWKKFETLITWNNSHTEHHLELIQKGHCPLEGESYCEVITPLHLLCPRQTSVEGPSSIVRRQTDRLFLLKTWDYVQLVPKICQNSTKVIR